MARNTNELLDRVNVFLGAPTHPDRRAADPVNLPAIRRFVDAIGDDNPIYLDAAAARATGRTGVVAPPAMLPTWTMAGYRETVASTSGRSGALAELAAAGFRVTPAVASRQVYCRELRPGDQIRTTSALRDVSPEKHTSLGPAHFVTIAATFYDQRDEVVGEHELTLAAFNPDAGSRRASSAQPSGAAEPVDSPMPPLEITFDRVRVIACSAACGDFRDGHHDPDRARAIGMRDIFTDIPTSAALAARFVTDWAGPPARLQEVEVHLGVPLCAGDTLRLTGRTTATEDGRVRVDLEGRTQFGRHLRGHAIVTIG